jgi:hypothetical protein
VRKSDLERLAGKMVFVCSVVPGGRTFMREILNTMNNLRQKSHWAHLSAGFQSDLRWWKRFALKWNGVESIPPRGVGLRLMHLVKRACLALDLLLRTGLSANAQRRSKSSSLLRLS